MNIVFLHEGITQSLVPLLTLIEHHPDCVVGCILMRNQRVNKEPAPEWFGDIFSSNDTALALLDGVKEGKVAGSMSAFLVIREPNSFLQLSVLAAINCFNFNSSGEGGKGGKKLLEVLTKQNIRTSLSKAKLPLCEAKFPFFSYSSKSFSEKNELIKAVFEEEFGILAKQWLPESWGLESVSYY
ncbi:MAG: hypothetical protein U1V55_12600 [Planktothrix rubescens PR222]